MPDVVVAIPTFRRPKGLERLLVALAGLDTGAQIQVLVADNDAVDRDGIAVIERMKGRSYRWPIAAMVVGERGIAHVRNALVARALLNTRAGYIAMLDDDEWPEPGWLEAFLEVARNTDADALHGAVLPVFERNPGPWVKRCRGLAPLRGSTGRVLMIHGTSNVLLRRSVLEEMETPWFDPQFALSGGEDKDFFTRLAREGARFAWADAAIVHAHVPVSRSNRIWALKRAYRVGNSDMRVFIKYERGFVPCLREGAKIAASLLLAAPAAVLLAPSSERRMMPACTLARAAGKLAAIFGAHYNEYSTIHGQ